MKFADYSSVRVKPGCPRRYLRLRLISWLLLPILAVVLTACGPASTPVKNTPPPPKPTAAAENHLAKQNYLAAAEEFWRLSSLGDDPQASQRNAMRAALAYIDAEQYEQAAAIIENTPADDAIASRMAKLASASLGEKSSQFTYSPKETLTQLEAIESRHLTPYQKGVYYRTLGRAHYHLGEFATAAKHLSTAIEYSQPQTEALTLHQYLWQAVAQLDSEQRSAIIQGGDKALVGWLALKDSTDSVIHDAAGLNNAVTRWRSQFSAHPANEYIVEQLFEISESLSRQASHIALLLPFEGRYQRAAEAIRNGFLSAWFADQSVTKPIVSVFSVTTENVAEIYQQAIANGADFVVGPLEKQTIEALLSSTQITSPLLLLNRIDATKLAQIAAKPELEFSAERVYQFGLSPEDEASSMARYIWKQGHRRLAALAPESSLGERLLGAFSSEWDTLGGTLHQLVEYSGDQTRYSSAVRKAFNLDYSSARAKSLIQTIGRAVIHQPRPRKDIDALFIGGLPLDNRQLIPQLRYYGVGNIPTYSSSHTYSGIADPGSDIDLDGSSFGDMPLILGVDSSNISYQSFRNDWPKLGPQGTRMYAFGTDSYWMTNNAAKMRYQNDATFDGATGILSVLRSGEIVRDLEIAKFVEGIPVVSRDAY